MSYLYRCNGVYKGGPFKGQRCQQRHSFKRKVESYVFTKKCPSCKNEITYMDKWQMKRNKETTCKCGMPVYPHRAGSHFLCRGYKGEVTDEMYQRFYGQ